MKNISGVSLIEILVTMAISVIGLVGLSSLQMQTQRAVMDTGNRSQAVWLVEELTNRIHTNVQGAGFYNLNGVMSCSSKPQRVCSAYHSGSARVNAAICTPQQLALWDLYETACGTGAIVATSDTTFSSPADYIAEPRLQVTVNNANFNETTITLRWNARTEGEQAGGKKAYITDSKLLGETTDKNNKTISKVAVRQASIRSVFQP